MEDHRVPLEAEIASVQRELYTLRDEYLPVFLALPPGGHFPRFTPDFVRAQEQQISQRLSRWRQAVSRLSAALSLAHRGESGSALVKENFSDFTFQEATPSYTVTDQGIHWEIGLFVNMVWVRNWCLPPALRAAGKADAEKEDLLAVLPEVKTRLLGLAIDGSVLANAFSMIVPFIADVDPSFAKLSLDPETWRCLVRGNATISEEQRQKWLASIDDELFRHAINNALLHVFGSLANNHFMAIRDYLDHPCLYGGYTGLMPHYLFALLFQKVSMLRQLTTEGSSTPVVANSSP
jgi:hypothetical protein